MILALDLGTTRVKGGLFAPTGSCAGLASSALPALHFEDPMVHEADAAAWIAAVREVTARLLQNRVEPSCIVVSGNGPSLLPADREGRPLHAALTWMDRRAVPEARDASAIAGSRLDSSFYLPKALWFERHRPDLAATTAFYLGCPEYLVHFLTGRALAVFPGSGWEPFYWKGEWLSSLGLDASKFPPFVEPGILAGTSLPRAIEAGIPAGIPVVAGGPDFLAAVLGTASTVPGRACDRAGTSEGINLCATRDVADPRLLSMPHLIRPLRNISGSVSTSGRALEWWKSVSGHSGSSWADFLAAAARAPSGSRGLVFLPYLSGERAPIWDSAARGAFVGLTLAHGAEEMARAVVEATAFAMRDILTVMIDSGAEPKELRVAGKPASSAFWNQVKADVTGLPVVLPRFAEAELLGGACMGFTALGRYGSLAEAAEDLVVPGATFEPGPGSERYAGLFAAYREAYASLKPLFPKLGALGDTDSAAP